MKITQSNAHYRLSAHFYDEMNHKKSNVLRCDFGANRTPLSVTSKKNATLFYTSMNRKERCIIYLWKKRNATQNTCEKKWNDALCK